MKLIFLLLFFNSVNAQTPSAYDKILLNRIINLEKNQATMYAIIQKQDSAIKAIQTELSKKVISNTIFAYPPIIVRDSTNEIKIIELKK